MANYSVVGQSVYRTDANPKVTGRALHVGNIEMPGMLHVAVLRSPYPHARITRIEKSKAEKLPGVAVVLTGAEIAKMPGIDPHFGPAFRDQPILAVERVCYVGDPVVAVAAVDKRTAEDALQLVEVDYEPLPAVHDVLEAAKPRIAAGARAASTGQSVCRPRARQSRTAVEHLLSFQAAHRRRRQGVRRSRQNIRRHVQLAAGAACADGTARDAGLRRRARAPKHLDGESITVLCADGNFRDVRYSDEPRFACACRTSAAATAPSFTPSSNRSAPCLPCSRKKPVRYALTREEEFLTITKHKVVTKIKTAIKDGAITARKCEVYWDTGAYAEIGPRIGHKSGYTSAGPYRIPNVWIDSYCVYTNKVPAGAFRGFGVPQVIWAYDSQTDMIARALGADPVEFRLKPALDEGERFATGTPVKSFGVKEAIRQAAQAIEWSKPRSRAERHQAARQRHRGRRESGADAVDFGRHRYSQCRR